MVKLHTSDLEQIRPGKCRSKHDKLPSKGCVQALMDNFFFKFWGFCPVFRMDEARIFRFVMQITGSEF